VPSSISAIGSVVVVANLTTSNLVGGNNVAGSSLSYASAITTITGNRIYTNGNPSTNSYTLIQPPETIYIMGQVLRWTNGNTGYAPPDGFTALSGTWRLLNVGIARSTVYDSYYGQTFNRTALTLAVRIA
jgi:hypothetical protein